MSEQSGLWLWQGAEPPPTLPPLPPPARTKCIGLALPIGVAFGVFILPTPIAEDVIEPSAQADLPPPVVQTPPSAKLPLRQPRTQRRKTPSPFEIHGVLTPPK